jgi:hypothetical protein
MGWGSECQSQSGSSKHRSFTYHQFTSPYGWLLRRRFGARSALSGRLVLPPLFGPKLEAPLQSSLRDRGDLLRLAQKRLDLDDDRCSEIIILSSSGSVTKASDDILPCCRG